MTDNISPALERNLHALYGVDRRLVERLCLPVDDRHIEIDGAGVWYRIQDSRTLLEPTPERADAILRGATRPARLFGIGAGTLLEAAVAQSPDGRIDAWERDPWLMRLALSTRDYSAEIRSRRLRLSLGVDLIDLLGSDGPWVYHPVLGAVYREERALVAHGLGPRRALLCAGTLFVGDLGDALRSLGFSVYTWDVTRLAPEELSYTAHRLRPEVAASVNYTNGLAELCTLLNVPYRCWEIDPSVDRLKPYERGGDVRVFTWRRAQVADWQAAGFTDTCHLPLATNPDKRRPTVAPPSSGFAFVGASMVSTARAHRQTLIEGLVRIDPSPGTVDQRIEQVLAAQRGLPTTYVLPESMRRAFPTLDAFAGPDPTMLAGEIAAAEYRLTIVASLGDLGLEVWGDDGWSLIEGSGTRWRGPAGHHDELTRIYATHLVNLDIGRIYQRDIVTMRIFDALSCGGFVLAEHSDELASLFEVGREVDTWQTLDELRQKTKFYLDHPHAAHTIAIAGRNRVLRDHTIRDRVRTMLGDLVGPAQ